MTKTTDYDIIIIGAGIHGAGVAQAAAAAGYRALVLEKTAVAAGTSSKSSKLIHGGLRYLETAQFSLVRECLLERQLLLKLAPELIALKPFYIPIYRQSQRSSLQIRAGLCLYSCLGGLSKATHFQTLPPSHWSQLNGLSTEGLQSVFRYYDAQTDDSALTRAVLQSACSLGAEIHCPATPIAARFHNQGCELEIVHKQRQQTLSCHAIVNCAGPWGGEVLQRLSPDSKLPAIELVQGTHLLMDVKHLEHWPGIFYLEAPSDGRAVFAIPWNNKLMVGTTETLFTGKPDQAVPLKTEVDYLQQTLHHYFPDIQQQIIPSSMESFCGLRVLPDSQKSPFRRSRDTLLHQSSPRLTSLLGGKLTTYRLTAQKALEQIRPCLPDKRPTANTRDIRLAPTSCSEFS